MPAPRSPSCCSSCLPICMHRMPHFAACSRCLHVCMHWLPCSSLLISPVTTYYRPCLSGSLLDLPPAPAEPLTTNLDVTTMCALVSEVCHAGPANPAVVAW